MVAKNDGPHHRRRHVTRLPSSDRVRLGMCELLSEMNIPNKYIFLLFKFLNTL